MSDSPTTFGQPEPWVTSHAHLVSPGPILDLACGKGRHGRYFLPQHPVTFIDKKISGVSDLAPNPNVQLIEYDLENEQPWPFKPEQFSCIVVINYLHRPLFPYVLESLIPNGILIYKTFAEGNEKFGRPRNPNFLLKENELLEIVKGDFEVINFFHGKETNPDRITQSICARKIST